MNSPAILVLLSYHRIEQTCDPKQISQNEKLIYVCGVDDRMVIR